MIEGRDVADVRPQPSVPHPLDDLTQLGTIGFDNEVDRQAVGGPRLRRPDDGHQCSSGLNEACGPLLDVAADDIEHQIDAADVFQRVVLEVDELLRAEVERLLTVGSASGAEEYKQPLGRSFGRDNKVGEVCSLLRRSFRPEGEQLASILSGMRAMSVAGLEMQRSASLVLLALIGEVALNNIKRLGHALVEMCRNDRAGFHTDMQYYRPQRVIRIADAQRDVALTGEGETIRLEVTLEYFLIDHDTGSCF